MAHALGLSAIAEGVETREQREFLRTNRCDALQGNFFSKAVPAAELKAFLGASTARAARTDVR
jgi:EAL domain-containing protein (putative c-di-GMP-specific phosphodiesterase class I)